MPSSVARPHTGASVLRGSLGAFRGRLAAAATLFCGHQTGEALVPVLVGVVIDEAVGTGDPAALIGWLALLGVDFLFLSTCYRFGARQAWHADVHADARLRMQLADRLLDARGGAEAGRLPGGLAILAVSDAKRVAIVSFMLPLGVAAVAAVAVAAVSLLTISLPLGLLILLGTPPLLWLVQLVGKPLERRSGAEQERAAQASGVAADLVTGIRVLKGIGAEKAAMAAYVGTSRTALGATLRATRAEAGFLGSVQLGNGLFLALIALIGGRLAADGEISVGGLVAAVGLAQFLVGPLQVFGFVSARLAQGRASAARIAEVLGAGHTVGEGDAATPHRTPGGALTLRGIGGGGLDRLDLDVPAGQLLGVVVPDPAQASTLLRYLAREAEPGSGRVELDGTPLGAYPPDLARTHVLVAAHDAHLFAGTLVDNVLAGGPGDRDLDRVMAAAQADQAADSLPAGRDTEITARGSSLSGGQRQRVALARALAADPAVLVLHDPTTAVDAVTETRIADGLREVRRGRTTVLVTTSPALLAVTERVVVLESGRIRAEGTHADLLRDDAAYRALVTG
ncbi:ABC transporter ATP-binding protein [Pseudonocardia sp. KRD291]|uniref:ABC transporter ATP-binding protein n=1 Tax=Pseudonocardia sp. KRD291 TaxID=2792007 RepID=UPI001C49EBF1|nr:ABC transporter ATP-binding protein [Pseudonocardia sp. KRD291]MBW0101284.1 ABC transporter ATP-binding protein [Pseudonocardia sp. KRD291]